MTDPSDFISPPDESISGQILALAGFNSTKWMEMDRLDRVEAMCGAIIAYLETYPPVHKEE